DMDRKLILFQGDSITDAGRNRNIKEANSSLGHGFVTMLAGKIGSEYPWIDVMNKGVGGNRIADIYGRWQEDTLNIKFDMLSFLSGINDIGFGIRMGIGSDAKRFEFIYDRMIYEAVESHPNAVIVLGQPFILRKNLTNTVYFTEWKNDIYVDWNIWSSEMKRRGEIIQKISEKYHTMYVPFWDALIKAQERIPVEQLTLDCIHLTAAGNYILAQTWWDMTKELLKNWANV
ncbi:MAG: hypothetical protein IJZ44_09740, partial [Lachnospiraceae bacterium]|nr:hypothetical protein [Lachnospiraceae bacterium]